jgi:quercetin 2,3-dioxygenase
MTRSNVRSVQRIWKTRPTIEGAGVRLNRVFGFDEAPTLDPFLLLDDFRSDNPEDYLAGFPWHPHRGIETITYVLAGDVEHGDSMGNRGVIGAGDVQWMTAGSGIIHQEMPKGDAKGRMHGFQLWANLPAREKMMGPRYREVKDATIPMVTTEDGARVRVISGEVAGTRGPVREIVTDPEYLDVSLPSGAVFTHAVRAGHTVLAYVVSGSGSFAPGRDDSFASIRMCVHYGDGESVAITSGKEGLRFLLISGKPIKEPVAWRGPIVMNTDEELDLAFQEYHDGTFVKKGS